MTPCLMEEEEEEKEESSIGKHQANLLSAVCECLVTSSTYFESVCIRKISAIWIVFVCHLFFPSSLPCLAAHFVLWPSCSPAHPPKYPELLVSILYEFVFCTLLHYLDIKWNSPCTSLPSWPGPLVSASCLIFPFLFPVLAVLFPVLNILCKCLTYMSRFVEWN